MCLSREIVSQKKSLATKLTELIDALNAYHGDEMARHSMQVP